MLECMTGEQLRKSNNCEDNARVDIAARSFWMKGQRAYFDVRVFNPLPQTYRQQSLSKVHLKQEQEKKKLYNERVLQVQHGTFTPLVFSSMGGMARECDILFSKLAAKVAEKRDINESEATTFIRTKLSFALVRATHLCLCGSRSWKRYSEKLKDVDFGLAVEESQCTVEH